MIIVTIVPVFICGGGFCNGLHYIIGRVIKRVQRRSRVIWGVRLGCSGLGLCDICLYLGVLHTHIFNIAILSVSKQSPQPTQ